MWTTCNTFKQMMLYKYELHDRWMAYLSGKQYIAPTTKTRRARYLRASQLELAMRHKYGYRKKNLIHAVWLQLQLIGAMASTNDPRIEELVKELIFSDFSVYKTGKNYYVKTKFYYRSAGSPRDFPLHVHRYSYRQSRKTVDEEVIPALETIEGTATVTCLVLRCPSADNEQACVDKALKIAEKFNKEWRRLERKNQHVISDARWSCMMFHPKRTDDSWRGHWHLYTLTSSRPDPTRLQDVWKRMGGGLVEWSRECRIESLKKPSTEKRRKHVASKLATMLTYGANWQKDQQDPETFLNIGAALRGKRLKRSLKRKLPSG